MQTITLEGFPREEHGSRACRRLRREGWVPAALYGRGGPRSFKVKHTAAEKIVFTPHTYLVELHIEDLRQTALLREYQLHPVHDYILHLDFWGVAPEDEVVVSLPIRLVGTAQGVQMGGKLVPLLRRLKVRGRVQDLPDAIEIDVTPLQLGKSLIAGKVSIPNLLILTPPDAAIARIEIPRALRTQQG
ncbi:MAG: 50S ribosomal protein L25 [Bacteroidota bacterium]|nr:50S ribosomal protein L25 [Bacteroidota bacterium]